MLPAVSWKKRFNFCEKVAEQKKKQATKQIKAGTNITVVFFFVKTPPSQKHGFMPVQG